MKGEVPVLGFLSLIVLMVCGRKAILNYAIHSSQKYANSEFFSPKSTFVNKS